MQKNWYILYTKAKCEKKVAALLTKKKIKNFYPIHCRQENQFSRMKLVYEALFPSYVFVYMQENELRFVKKMNHVVNFVYWKGEPAIIQNEEIYEMTEFVTNHQNIRLERSPVSLNCLISVIDRPSYSIDGNIVIIKNKYIKLNLPSLGYVMVADMEGKGFIGIEVKVGTDKRVLF